MLLAHSRSSNRLPYSSETKLDKYGPDEIEMKIVMGIICKRILASN